MVKNDINENPVTSGQFKEFQSYVEKAFRQHTKLFAAINKTLQQHTKNFQEINKTLKLHTSSLVSIENTMAFYGYMYQMNKEGLEKLNVRVEKLENA